MNSPLADAVATLLREVGKKTILPRFGALADSDIETKSDPTDFVTVADREAEQWLTPRLRRLVDCPVIGEEACAENPAIRDAVAAPRAWTVDPVDGTSNFVKGNGRFCSMIALLEYGVPVASWIWVPLTETLYMATAGDGAMLVTPASRKSYSPGKARWIWRRWQVAATPLVFQSHGAAMSAMRCVSCRDARFRAAVVSWGQTSRRANSIFFFMAAVPPGTMRQLTCCAVRRVPMRRWCRTQRPLARIEMNPF